MPQVLSSSFRFEMFSGFIGPPSIVWLVDGCVMGMGLVKAKSPGLDSLGSKSGKGDTSGGSSCKMQLSY